MKHLRYHGSGVSRPWEHRVSHSRMNDAARLHIHGPLVPMEAEQSGFFFKLFGGRR